MTKFLKTIDVVSLVILIPAPWFLAMPISSVAIFAKPCWIVKPSKTAPFEFPVETITW
ncbi:hypothetical protein D3C85_1691180 [compost metagenome]